MKFKLTLNVFRFNHTSDYLPYYKTYVIKTGDDKSLSELLAMIQEEDKDFGFPTDKFASIKVNGIALFTALNIKDIIENFGQELTLEPLTSKRATKDLTFNNDDFLNRFDILDAFVDASDKKLYKSYIKEYYISPITGLEEDYIGDSLLSFAYDMIEKYPHRKNDILNAISSEENGIWLHVNISKKLFPQDCTLEDKVENLKNKIIAQIKPANGFIKEQKKLSAIY